MEVFYLTSKFTAAVSPHGINKIEIESNEISLIDWIISGIVIEIILFILHFHADYPSKIL